MKILVISQYFTPDITAAAFRVSESCDLLKEMGHEVNIVTSTPHKSNETDYLDDNRLQELRLIFYESKNSVIFKTVFRVCD